MFYWQDLKGVVNAIKRQKPFFPLNTDPVPLPSQSSPVTRYQETKWNPSFDTKCLTVVVNVLVEQLKVLDRERWGRAGVQGPAEQE